MASLPKLGRQGKVSLLGDMELVPTLEEIQKINKETQGMRAPAHDVIHGIWPNTADNGVGRLAGQS